MRPDLNSSGIDHCNLNDFRRLATFIQDYSGIKMPSSKQTMLEGRLRKRLAATGSVNFESYCRYFFDQGGYKAETAHLIDAVVTNKTEFFREPAHFRFLVEVAMPQILSMRRDHDNKPIKLWSAASSTGAEPYTLAMVMADLRGRLGSFQFNIVASDISTRVLEIAVAAIYPHDTIGPVPLDMRKRYMLRDKNETAGLVRLVPQIRALVQFRHLNLMDASYPMDRDMDIIFCRNILIYFDKPTQQEVLRRLCAHLRPGGCLFLGHAESMTGFGLPLLPIGPTVFRRE